MKPPSQKYRPIGFYLTGGSEPSVRLDLPVRPEEMSRQEPMRLNAVQTIGGAYVDSFGPALASITLSGHCGWRGSYFVPGEDSFNTLRDVVFAEWARRRSAATKAGTDPTGITLFYVDTLNGYRYEVAPKSFVTRRSKASPLLIRYQITLTVLDDGSTAFGITDQIIQALSNPLRWVAGVTGLGATIQRLDGLLRTGMNMLGAARQATTQVLGIATSLFSTVSSVASAARGVFDGANATLLATARTFAIAGRNAFAALAEIPGFSSQDRAQLMAGAMAFNDAYCSMWNSFGVGRYFKSYSDLLGASNCSSTSGGEPISRYVTEGINPFISMFPAVVSPVAVTAQARSAMAQLGADPMPIAGDETATGLLMGTMAEGIRLNTGAEELAA